MRPLAALLFLVFALPCWAKGAGDLEREAREALRAWEEVQQVEKKWQEERRALVEQRDRLRLEVRLLRRELEKFRGYNENLSREIAYLEGRIEELGRYRRELEPYLLELVGRISGIVEQDLPFSPEGRKDRVSKVKGILEDPDVPIAEKLRAVLELLKAELEYSRTVEVAEGKIAIGGEEKRVYLLRLGRVGLYWLTFDKEEGGWFDPRGRHWVPLPGYEEELRKFLEMAQRKRAAELIRLPLEGLR